MTGEELYKLWRVAMTLQNVGTDDWESIGPHEQDAWEHVAGQVMKVNI